MKYLISGATGYVGRALCHSLIDDGHDVIVWARNASNARNVLPSTVVVTEDLANAPAVDVVVNLAGENLATRRWTRRRKEALVSSRIETTQTLVDWLQSQRTRVEVLISGSAVGFYGPRGDEALVESSPRGDDFAARLCEEWEQEAMHAAPYVGRVCCLRIGIVVSRDGGAVARMIPPMRFGVGSRYGSGRQWISWIARSDLIRMIQWVAQNTHAHGVYNATAPAPLTNSEFLRSVGSAMHQKLFIPVPAILLRTVLGEMADLLLTGQRVMPLRAIQEGFQFANRDLTHALE